MADASASTRANSEQQQKQQVRETVEGLLSGLNEADRVLLVLKEVEGLSLREMEKIYDVNENALKVRLFRARQRVLKTLAAQDKPGI